jgi:hypothetical protein
MARPREFDTDAALDGAIGVFREHGFQGSSAQTIQGTKGVPDFQAEYEGSIPFTRSTSIFDELPQNLAPLVIAIQTRSEMSWLKP